MRKLVVCCVMVFLLASTLLSFSQQNTQDVFYKHAQIVKIYTHMLGYKVVYRKSNLRLGEFFVPMNWFKNSGGKGEIVWGSKPSYPYFSVFWVDGKFNHIRLYVVSNVNSHTWGVLEGGKELIEDFQIEELNIEF